MAYNHSVFLLYLGGVFSLLLTVAVVFLKQIQKRAGEKKRLEQMRQFRPEEVGDVDAKLNDSIDFKFPNFLEEIAIWGIQPLFIISFLNLFEVPGQVEIIFAFLLVILTLFHEFYLAEQFSRSLWYQFAIIGMWLLTFLIFSYRTNQSETSKGLQMHRDSSSASHPN